jgi:hypothetical protein
MPALPRWLQQSRAWCRFLVFHHSLGVAAAAGGCASVDCDDDGHRAFDGLYSTVDVAARYDLLFGALEDFLGVGDLREAQFLGHLRTDLSVSPSMAWRPQRMMSKSPSLRIPVQAYRGGERIGTSEHTVGEEHAFVGSAEDSFLSTSRPSATHCDHGDGGAWVGILQAERLLQGVQISG